MENLTVEANHSFESAFSREILQSEVRRASALILIFGFATFIFLIQPIILPDFFTFLAEAGFPFWVPPAYFFFNACYGFVLRNYFKFAFQTQRRLSLFVRYGSAFYESTLPTIAILFLGSYYHNSLDALNTPPSFVYFFFIILSTLRLEERMAVFTGFVSAIQYIAIFLYFKTFSFNAAPVTLLENDYLFYGKAMILLGSGFMAGFVTHQIKRAVTNSFKNEVDKNQIRALFGQHVSPEVVNQLLAQKDDWEGEIRHVCMMFFDIRNFTQFSETQTPSQLIQFLNKVFSSSIDCVNRNGGIINKFLGDGFMAVFGAPVSEGRDVLNAVQAASEIKATLHKLIDSGVLPNIGFGIGLHCGDAVTGNVGSSERKEYTIIGDVVNLASRIEQLNKEFQTEILVSEDVFKLAHGHEGSMNLIGDVNIKGKSLPVKIYEWK